MTHLDITVPVRWTDLDAYGHVNNAAMVRLLEEARIAAFWQPSDEEIALGASPSPAGLGAAGVGAQVSTVIASQRIEYARSLGHRREGVTVSWRRHLLLTGSTTFITTAAALAVLALTR